MTLASRFEIVLLLIAASILLNLVARRLRLPTAATLIVGGAAVALVPGMPDLGLDPELSMVLFLPPLLMSSAYFTTWRDFRADLRIILQLAVGAVVFTTLAVGVAAHLAVPGLPWAACFALGAIVSPPDAVAAKAVLHGLGLPRRMVTLLEGESLVNDASGLVLYRFAVAAALTGTFDRVAAAESFCLLVAGGVAFGLVAGLAASTLLGRMRDAELSAVASLLVAWGSYIGADRLGLSGVLSTVACGIVLGWRQHALLGAAQRLQARAVWDVVIFVGESLVFILIGLSLRGVLHRISADPHGLHALLPQVAAVVAAVVLSRFAWIVPTTYLVRALAPGLRRRDPYPPLGVPVVISWAGMRGVVSLAAALALPEDFPGRDFILAATFAVILVTVLVQGSTLAPLIRAVGIGEMAEVSSSGLGETDARLRMASAQLAAVRARSTQPDGTERHPRLVEQYGYRVRAVARFREADGGLEGERAEHFATVLAAVSAGREELLRLHRAGEIHDTVLHALEHELDLDEMRAGGFASRDASG
ncbi:MAG: Na+/H+ antiporter [Janthinobacterium lividum]